MSSRAECIHDPALALGEHVLTLVLIGAYACQPTKSSTSQTLWLVFKGNLEGWPVPFIWHWQIPGEYHQRPALTQLLLSSCVSWDELTLLEEDHIYRDVGTLVEWWPSYHHYFQHDCCFYPSVEFLISMIISATIYQEFSCYECSFFKKIISCPFFMHLRGEC